MEGVFSPVFVIITKVRINKKVLFLAHLTPYNRLGHGTGGLPLEIYSGDVVWFRISPRRIYGG
jgi:hypothetical protein